MGGRFWAAAHLFSLAIQMDMCNFPFCMILFAEVANSIPSSTHVLVQMIPTLSFNLSKGPMC